MLYKFKSKVAGDVIMTGPAGDHIVKLMGKEATPTGIILPADMPRGNYSVLLNLSDPMPSLSGRPEYSIQLANTNAWEASTGFNNLNHTFSVAP